MHDVDWMICVSSGDERAGLHFRGGKILERKPFDCAATPYKPGEESWRRSDIVQENLVARRVGRLRTAIYASKIYLKRNAKKKQWAAHDWVALEEHCRTWPSEMDARKHP